MRSDVLELQRRLRAVIASEEPLSSSLLELNDSQQRTRRLKVEAEVVIYPEGHSELVLLNLAHASGGDALAPNASATEASAPGDQPEHAGEEPPAPTPSAGEQD